MEGVRTRRRSEGETLTIFEDVFVLWERVFVCKDIAVASGLALMGGAEAVIHVHAEGSIEASKIELYRSYNYREPKRLIENLLSEMEKQTTPHPGAI